MENTKKWKNIDSSEKIAFIVVLLMGALLETGIALNAKKYVDLKHNVLKTQMVNHR